MKILIYGAGVIGCTYAWQLSEAGYDITVLVKPEKKQTIEKNGITIHCKDFRSKEIQVKNIIFRPPIIDRLSSGHNFNYIIVSTGCNHLEEILSVLKESAGEAHILFFQNLWISDFEMINKYLSPSQYFFGFPFMAGGGKDSNNINSIISGSKYSKTMLGEADGKVSDRIERIASAMEKANMKPFISEQIKTWLTPHYAFIAGFSQGMINAGGSMKDFLSKKNSIKEAVLATREGFHICSQVGFDPKKEKVNKLYYMPMFICIPVIRKVFSDKSMVMMFDGYIKHASDEVKLMTGNIMNSKKGFLDPR